MPEPRITAHALDVILKLEAEQLAVALPRHFGIAMPPIVRPYPTELPQLDLHVERLDTIFELADSSLLHMEYQSEHRQDTLLRFLAYDLALYRQHQRPIRTVVVYGPGTVAAPSILDIIAIRYQVTNIFMGHRDGEEAYRRLRERVEHGAPLDEGERLDLVFLPLMAHRHPLEEVVASALVLTHHLPAAQQQQAMGTLLGLAYHYIGQDAFNRLMEGLMATNYEILDKWLTHYVERRSEERAEQLAEQRVEQTKRNDVLKVLASRFGPVPALIVEQIAAQTDLTRLETLFDLALGTPTLDAFAEALAASPPTA